MEGKGKRGESALLSFRGRGRGKEGGKKGCFSYLNFELFLIVGG